MAPRRGTKQAKVVYNEELYKNLKLSDALCPICRYILILPVTLPCNHNFCYTCFEGTVANANLTCPLCRVRFASWHRIAKKDEKIVNNKLWFELQRQFGEKVQNRQNGLDESFEEEASPIRITTAGEIRKEYQLEKKRQELELQKQREEEEKASAELISKLRAADALEDSLYEEKLRLDEKVAREIGEDIGKMPKFNNTPKKRPLDKLIQNMKLNVVPTKTDEKHETTETELPQHRIASSTSTSGEREKEKNAKQKNLMNFTEVIEISDSNDSIENECRYFKPIDHRNIPPSTSVTPVKVPAVFSKNINFKFESPSNSYIQLQSSKTSAFAKVITITRKRKISENSRLKMIKKLSLVDPERIYTSLKSSRKDTTTTTTTTTGTTADRKLPHTMTLRDRKPSNASPTFSNLAANFDNGHQPINGIKVSLQSRHDDEKLRREQEKTDLELAKKLQEEFNRERYTTRSSISCRNNIKKPRQLTLTEIMSTSKCK